MDANIIQLHIYIYMSKHEMKLYPYRGGVDGLADVVAGGNLAKGLPILEGIAVLEKYTNIRKACLKKTILKQNTVSYMLKVLVHVFRHKRNVCNRPHCPG